MTFRSLWPVLAAAALSGGYFIAKAIPPSEGDLHLRAAGALPVVDGGRVKPLDTVARASLILISGRQVYRDENGVDRPALRWLFDVMSAGTPGEGPAAKYEVFRIENDQVLKLLGLKNRPNWYRYSLDEIAPHFDDLNREAMRAAKLDDSQHDLFDTKVLELRRKLEMYIELARGFKPLAVPPDAADEEWRSAADVDEDAQDRVTEKMRAALKDVDRSKLTPEQQAELARKLRSDLAAARKRISPAAAAWEDLLVAFRTGQAAGFNQSATDAFNAAETAYAGQLAADIPAADWRRARYEQYFNQFEPFYQCLCMYTTAFLLAAMSWVAAAGGWSVTGPLRRAAVALAVTTVVVHTAALFTRMFLMDRPFVFITNLYSTAIFIGWAVVIIGLLVELIFGMGLGTAVATAAGAMSLIIAHFLALDTPKGDTMEMLQAVLDTSFWLATHVTIVNLGYAATFGAGLFGVVYVGLGLTTRTLAGPLGKTLSQIIYGVVCFGTLASFVGTVLGGIWADQSWGRFWGWDPKENGALLIVIWNALILHARWAGVIKARGVATLAVLGNIIVVWSWFATNELGIGLHAYGASSGDKRLWIDIAWGTHLAIGLTAALVPLRYWRSFSPAARKAALAARNAAPALA
jgi:ABC-type transport system involved in cytochrome c biogenesis permease subunit